MATLVRRWRQRLGGTSMFMLAGLVGTLCGSGWGAPDIASAQEQTSTLTSAQEQTSTSAQEQTSTSAQGQTSITLAQEQTSAIAVDTNQIPFFLFFPPVVKFIGNGQYTGTLQTEGIFLSFTGTVEYLSGSTQLIKNSVESDSSWVTITPTIINAWEIDSTAPTACQKEVLSGASYPQCAPWKQTGSSPVTWSLDCTDIGHTATFNILAVTNSGNQLVSLTGTTNISGMTDSTTTITIDSQSTTPPPASDITLPGICSL